MRMFNKRTVASLVLIACLSTPLLGLGGCYGSFTLTKKLYDWNGTIGSPLVQNLVFWALLIIPVYELATLGDAVILNLIEFWTGSNPMATNGASPTHEVLADGSIQIQLEERVYTLTPKGENRFEIMIDGATKGYVEVGEDGSALLVDAEGERSLHLSVDDIFQARTALVGAH